MKSTETAHGVVRRIQDTPLLILFTMGRDERDSYRVRFFKTISNLMGNANPANTTFLRWLSLLIISLLSRPADAQSGNGDYDTYTTWSEFVTEYLEQNIDEDALEAESDLRQDLQFMEDLHLRPQNINTAAKEDILRLAFMTEAQADSILSYRSRKREFFSLGELQFVSGLTPVQRKWLSLFFYAERIDSRRAYAQKGKNRHLFITNLDVPFYKRAGNRQHTEEEYKNNPNCMYWGNALANTVRYRFSHGKQFSAGTTLQKDAGEPFAGCGNYPYDYVSAYAHLISTNGKWQAWLGDFNVRSNHGLIFSSGLFKNMAQINGLFSSKPLQIKPHSSCDETNFFRGLALARQGRVWNAAAFFSLRKLDARLENDTVTSFSKTGFHRTQTELERKNNVRNLTTAMQLGYNKNRLKLAFTFAFDNYDHVVWPKEQPFNLYFMRGKSACAFSCDYHIRSADRKWIHSGETAIDRRLHAAMTHTVRYSPSSRLLLTGQIRHFSLRFISIHGNAMQEGSRIQNETGITLGMNAQLPSSWEFTSYAEYFRFPRETFSATAKNSQGFAFSTLATYSPSPRLTYKIRYRYKTKQRDIPRHKGTLQYAELHKLTLTTISPFLSGMTLWVSGDALLSVSQTSKMKSGYMLSSRFSWEKLKQLSLDAFAAVFSTKADNRFYAYEPQLSYAGAFPSFFHRGLRLVGQCRWKPFDFMQVSARFGLLHYFNKDSIASGAQLINSSTKSDLNLQLIMRF